MARNKGKDFENCLMYAAWSTAGLDLTAKGYDKLYAEADSTVKTFSFKCLEKIFRYTIECHMKTPPLVI